MATYSAWQATIQNEFGDILPGAEITVVNESTGLPATIYSGRTGGALTNPFFADVNGFAQFYAEPSEYRITAIDGGSGFTNTWRYVEIGALLSVDDVNARIDQVEARITGKNYLINANLNTTIINQRGFGGGQPAAGVYGYDRWKGDALGTRIEQVVENSEVINETFTISWVGGTGTADVDGVTGLNSGDSFTLNTSTNFSVIVPTDATYIQLETGSVATPFEYVSAGDNLAACQRYYEKSYNPDVYAGEVGTAGSEMYTSSSSSQRMAYRFATLKRAQPSMRIFSPSTGQINRADGGASGVVEVQPSQIGLSGSGMQSGAVFAVGESVTFQWDADAEL